MANKKKLPVSIVELVWYPICALVIIWGLTYVVLGLITKYNNDLTALAEFNANFKKLFGLNLYFCTHILLSCSPPQRDCLNPVLLFPIT